MSITERDEFEHPAGEDWLWRESLYFGFHDASGKVSGMTTIGARANQNRAEGLAAILLSDELPLLYGTASPLDAENAGLCTLGGISYEMVAPLKQWRVKAEADFSSVDPLLAGQGPPSTVPASFDLVFEASGPAHEFSPDALGPISGRSRHYEQNGRVAGTVDVGGQTFIIDGFGTRDHSWGIRDLSRAGRVVVLFAPFGPYFAVNAIWGVGEGQEIATGYIYRDGLSVPIDGIQIAVESDARTGLPKTARADISILGGEQLCLQATVTSVLPIFLDQGSDRLQWCECAARFLYSQQVCYGTIEVTEMIKGAALSHVQRQR